MLSNYKKAVITILLLAISSYSFASLEDCYKTGLNENYKEALEKCEPYAKKDFLATVMYGSAEVQQEDYKDGLLNLEWTINYSKSNKLSDREKEKSLSGSYVTAGNIYYFGQAGKADKTKGLEYITKAANLGNDFAQSQLGDFYNSQGGDPDLNISQTYKWYTLSKANGRSLDFSDFANNLKNQAPYCLAMGEQLVAQAYLDGIAGLSKDKSKAKKYLSQAIAIYKDNEPTKASYKYCAKQKGLDLASAEKLLGSL
jgi:TPR repeat protein